MPVLKVSVLERVDCMGLFLLLGVGVFNSIIAFNLNRLLHTCASMCSSPLPLSTFNVAFCQALSSDFHSSALFRVCFGLLGFKK